jgi:secernin
VCDTLCLRSGAGMVFAKNSDRPPDEAQVLLAHCARPGGGTLHTQYVTIADAGAVPLIASHPTWLWGAEHGVNAHGVAIGNERIWTTDNPRAQAVGLIGMDLVRLGLERARNADDALSIMTAALAEHGQGGSGEHDHDAPYFSSFLIADARGGWLLETSARTWAARPVGDGTSISNRVTLDTDWTVASPDVAPGTSFDAWRSRRIRTSIADHRLAATRSCVARGASAAVADVVATLRDHGNGRWGEPAEAAAHPVPRTRYDDDRHVTVCMHLTDDQATTASFVAELRVDGPPRAWVCLGSPCVSVYVPTFLSVVPAILRDPEQWQRFAQLRDRVETEVDALASVRAVLAPVERELWEQADAADAEGTQAPQARFAADASRRVDAALTALGV